MHASKQFNKNLEQMANGSHDLTWQAERFTLIPTMKRMHGECGSWIRERALVFRKHPTPAEALLRQAFRSIEKSYRLRNQHTMFGYVVDFFIPKHRIVIELDGDSHQSEEARRHDAKRTRILRQISGLEVIRIPNREVYENPQAVALRLHEYIMTRPVFPSWNAAYPAESLVTAGAACAAETPQAVGKLRRSQKKAKAPARTMRHSTTASRADQATL
jgi:very-short-patch-repair endonuclease